MPKASLSANFTHPLTRRHPNEPESSDEKMAAHDSITVDIPYVKRNDDGQIPNHAQMFSHDAEFLDLQPAEVRNVRAADQEFSIPTTGFQYAKLAAPPEIDYLDDEQVRKTYFPMLEKLLKEEYVG